MRIGLVIYGSLDQLSGGYLYDRQLVQAWRQLGHHVEVISLPTRSYAAGLTDNWDRHWRDRLTQSNPDVLVQDELCHPSLFHLNKQLQARTDFPLVSLVHHLRSQEIHPAPWRPWYRWIERRYLRSVDGFIFNSQPTRSSVETLIGRPVSGEIALPGKDHMEPEAQPTKPADGRAEGQGPTVLFVGNLIPRKGLHWLLDALESIVDQNWKLEIIGRADLAPSYAQSVQQRLQAPPFRQRAQLHGPVPSAELANYYQAADLLAVPSSHEGFGLVYLEAMGYGLPVLASAAGGAQELVRSGENGYLIEPGDTTELAHRLRRYLAAPQLRIQHGQAARRSYQQHPTWKESAQAALGYLERIS